MERARQRNRSRVPGAFLDDEMNGMAGEFSEDELARQFRLERMRQQRYDAEMADGNDYYGDGGAAGGLQDVLDYEDVKGKLSQWIQRPEVVRWIRKIFGHFLRTYTDDHNQNVHEQRINEMCSMNK